MKSTSKDFQLAENHTFHCLRVLSVASGMTGTLPSALHLFPSWFSLVVAELEAIPGLRFPLNSIEQNSNGVRDCQHEGGSLLFVKQVKMNDVQLGERAREERTAVITASGAGENGSINYSGWLWREPPENEDKQSGHDLSDTDGENGALCRVLSQECRMMVVWLFGSGKPSVSILMKVVLLESISAQ